MTSQGRPRSCRCCKFHRQPLSNDQLYQARSVLFRGGPKLKSPPTSNVRNSKISKFPKFLQIFLEHPERSIRERGALGKTRPPGTMRFKISSFLPVVSPEFASRPRRRRRAVLHAHARCKQRLAPGLSGAALIDELRYCHRACQHDSCPSRRRRRGRIRRGNIRARHGWSFMKRLVLASWGRYPRI